MATDAQDFDLRCRGAYQLADEIAESWQASRELKFAWAMEDVVRLYNEFLPQVIDAYETYCKTAKYPGDLTLVVNLYHLREFARHGGKLLEIAAEKSGGGFGVDGIVELRKLIDVAADIVREEDFATDMSLDNFRAE